VNEARISRQRIYGLNGAPLKSVDAWLNQYRTFWETSLTSLKAVVENKKAKEGPGIRKKKP
jgi:hypothetical protein